MYEATVILLTCRVECWLVQPFLDSYSLASTKAEHMNVPSISTPGYVPNSVCFTKDVFSYTRLTLVLNQKQMSLLMEWMKNDILNHAMTISQKQFV